MRLATRHRLPIAIALLLAVCASFAAREAARAESVPTQNEGNPTMELGSFSVSLAVKDIAASRAFYEKLGFTEFGGDQAQNWLIMKNGSVTIGLFQGMFPSNIMTFNPGWNQDATPKDDFQDVRELQATLREQGIELTTTADPDSTGPASFVITDPDGNTILFDQHVPRPGAAESE